MKTPSILLTVLIFATTVTATELLYPRRVDLFSPLPGKDPKAGGLRFLIFSEFLLFENADLTPYDDSTPDTILSSDDFMYTPWTLLRAGYDGALDSNARVHFAFSKAGFWGGDELSQGSVNNSSAANSFGANPVSIDELYGTWLFSPEHPGRELKIGRQKFTVDEQWFDDTIDGILLLLPESWGTLELLIFDWINSFSAIKNAPASLSGISGGAVQAGGYEGDTASMRFGLALSFPELLPSSTGGSFYAKGYSFLLRHGAGPGGNDRAGNWANFSDQDYILLSGLSFQARWDQWHCSLHGAYSTGVDRKQDSFTGENRDISTEGWALRAGISHQKKLPGEAISLFFSAQIGISAGPKLKPQSSPLNPDELPLKSYGFTAFEGRPFGGLLLGRYGGFIPHASPHGTPSLYDPEWLSHRGGVLHAEGSLGLISGDQFKMATEIFWAKDMSANLTGPRQTISGLSIGLEIDQILVFHISKHIQLRLRGAIFFPGEYPAALSFQETQTPFYGVSAGSLFMF